MLYTTEDMEVRFEKESTPKASSRTGPDPMGQSTHRVVHTPCGPVLTGLRGSQLGFRVPSSSKHTFIG